MNSRKMNTNLIEATSAVLTVGDGRGFVINSQRGPLVVTAAHCLPFFPPCATMSYFEERTYQRLLGPLNEKPAVWAECLFADPIADLAVLSSPDTQDLYRQADAYEALLDSTTPIAIADAPAKGRGWLLSLAGTWFECSVEHINNERLWVGENAQPIEGGMSGSPIISDACAAVGVVCTGGEPSDRSASLNPRLWNDLPGWLLREL